MPEIKKVFTENLPVNIGKIEAFIYIQAGIRFRPNTRDALYFLDLSETFITCYDFHGREMADASSVSRSIQFIEDWFDDLEKEKIENLINEDECV